MPKYVNGSGSAVGASVCTTRGPSDYLCEALLSAVPASALGGPAPGGGVQDALA
jgi:hypothetical protein